MSLLPRTTLHSDSEHVRSGIPAFLYICTWTLTWTCSIDMDMHHGHGHAFWTWTSSMGVDTQHSFDNAACIWSMNMHGCQNAGMLIKSPVRHR
jgi:hypothetical protein